MISGTTGTNHKQRQVGKAFYIKSIESGAEETAQWLTALADFAEDSASVASTHLPPSITPVLPTSLDTRRAHGTYTHTYANSQTQNKCKKT